MCWRMASICRWYAARCEEGLRAAVKAPGARAQLCLAGLLLSAQLGFRALVRDARRASFRSFLDANETQGRGASGIGERGNKAITRPT